MRARLRTCRGPSFLTPRGRFSVKGSDRIAALQTCERSVPWSLCIEARRFLWALRGSRRLAT